VKWWEKKLAFKQMGGRGGGTGGFKKMTIRLDYAMGFRVRNPLLHEPFKRCGVTLEEGVEGTENRGNVPLERVLRAPGKFARRN